MDANSIKPPTLETRPDAQKLKPIVGTLKPAKFISKDEPDQAGINCEKYLKQQTVGKKQTFKNHNVLNDTDKKDTELDYHIIGSGSSGNCVRIENVMIDIGLPYKYIKDDLYKTDIILITHCHSDHIKDNVFNRIRKEFPDIQIVGNHQVASRYELNYICNENTPFCIKGIEFLPFLGKHNVLCYGYIWKAKGYDIIYCTDSSDFDNSPDDMKYDYLFLESNHDQKKLAAIQKSGMYRKYGYNAYESGLRHCSTQRCMAFYYEHRKSKDSVLIELHKSERFY